MPSPNVVTLRPSANCTPNRHVPVPCSTPAGAGSRARSSTRTKTPLGYASAVGIHQARRSSRNSTRSRATTPGSRLSGGPIHSGWRRGRRMLGRRDIERLEELDCWKLRDESERSIRRPEFRDDRVAAPPRRSALLSRTRRLGPLAPERCFHGSRPTTRRTVLGARLPLDIGDRPNWERRRHDRVGERLSENAERARSVIARRFERNPRFASRLRWCQAVLAIQWLWSLSRLWVAATNRHSDCAAALPLRMNRSIRRLYLICP